MSVTTYKIKLTMSYADYGTRSYTLPVYTAPNSTNVKSAIAAFNAAANTAESDVAKTFISDYGAAPIGITEAEIDTITEEVIYSG